MDTGFAHQPQGASLLEFLRDPDFRSRCQDRARALDSTPGFPPVDDLDELRKVGLLSAPLPSVLGGCGWGTEPAGALDLMEALRLIGRASLPLGRLYEGHVNAVRLAAGHGTEQQRQLIRAAVLDGCLFGVWNTEPADRSLRVDKGRLTGSKILCSGIGVVGRALVTARPALGGPQQMLLVPLERFTPRGDLSDWNPSGMRASATGRIDLDGISLDDCLMLGGPDDYLAQPDFSGGAWRFLAVQLGGVEAVVEALRQHLLRTGRGQDPHQAARLGAALIAAETARLWTRQACLLAELGDSDPDRIVSYVDLARGAVERAALDVMELANRSIGLQAFMSPHPIERLVRDLATYLRQPAPDRALVAGAAAGLGFGESVGDMWP